MQPAASAGAVFQVESMNGAFQGVITTAGPLGMRMTRLRVPFDSHTRSSYATARSAYARKLRAPREITPRPERAEQHRHVRALDGREPLDVGIDQVGEAMDDLGAARRAERRPARERVRADCQAPGRPRARRRGRPRRWARASIGEMSVNVESLPTRSPPMKCSVETSTPATSTRGSSRQLFRRRCVATSTVRVAAVDRAARRR